MVNEHDPQALRPGTEILGEIAGAIASMPFTALDPFLAKIVEVCVAHAATEGIQLGVNQIIDRTRLRNSIALAGLAARSLGVDIAVVARQINSDPAASRAFVEAFRAAEFTDSAEKLKALGECIAELMSDSAQLDSEMWLIRQIMPIESYHMRILGCWILSETEWDGLRRRAAGQFGNAQRFVWSSEQLRQRSGLDVAGQLADELVRYGFLARIDPRKTPTIDTGYRFDEEPQTLRSITGGHDAWVITPLGTMLLDHVGGSVPWAGGGRIRRSQPESQQGVAGH